MTDSFSDYKTSHYRNAYEPAIKVDVNNYLYVIEKNSHGQATTFAELKNYFITADRCLSEWAMIQRPGTIPIFVLPSVWYSILLKYRGRAQNDYLAFCQFLNIRIAPEEDKLKDVKENILPYIMDIDEDVNVKEEIIYDIVDILNNSSDRIEDIPGFVEKVHSTVLDKRIREVTSKYDSEIKDLKKQVDNVVLEKSSQNFQEGQEDIINKQAKQIVKRNRIISNVINIFWIIVIVMLIAVMVASSLKNNSNECVQKYVRYLNENQGVIALVLFVLSFLIPLVKRILDNCNILCVDEERVKVLLRERYNN